MIGHNSPFLVGLPLISVLMRAFEDTSQRLLQGIPDSTKKPIYPTQAQEK
jgi:hypothetical protein